MKMPLFTTKIPVGAAVIQHTEAEVTDDFEYIVSLLEANANSDNAFRYNRRLEWQRFIHFAGYMLMAFPLGIFMRKRIRKNKRLNHILQFRELLQVRNNIEKGSFAYDTLLFKISPLEILQNKSHLANLVCLAILFGDEFIDGIAGEYGKQNIKSLLNNTQLDYNLHYKKIGNSYELYYAFDIRDMLPETVLAAKNLKYDITYHAFYDHLQFLLTEMNRQLKKLDEAKANEAALLICKVCNKCFDTYKADITEYNEAHSLADLLRYQKTKDDDIIQVLLTLRAVLLNKKQLQYQKHFFSWSSMVRSMQLYDDMQDVAGDCGFQMNILCYFARNYFTDEWQWLLQNKERLLHLKGIHLHTTISLHMPASCILTVQFARNIANTKLNWIQCKIQNYLWLKNWIGFNNPLLDADEFCLSVVMDKPDSSIPFKLYFIYKKVFEVEHAFISTEMKAAHVLDTAFMDKKIRDYIFDKISKREKYLLTNFYQECPLSFKAEILNRMLSA